MAADFRLPFSRVWPTLPRSRAGEVAEWSNAPDSKSGVAERSPGVRIPPSPPFFAAEGIKSEARLPSLRGNLSMLLQPRFAVSRFKYRKAVLSFRVDGDLNGVRIRRNCKSREDAAAGKSRL